MGKVRRVFEEELFDEEIEKEIKKAVKESGREVKEIPVGSIIPAPGFNRAKLEGIEELAKNIEEMGLLSPVVVRKIEGGYELIAGHRRLEAVKRLGWKKIPAFVLDVELSRAVQMRLSENLQRKELGDLERAEALFYSLKVLLGRDEEGFVRLLQRFLNRQKGNVVLNPEEEEAYERVKESLELVGFSLKSFLLRARFFLLEPEIREKVLSAGWGYETVKYLASFRRKRGKKEAEEFVERALAEGWSSKRVREELKKLLGKGKERKLALKDITPERIKKLPPEKRERAERLIEELLSLFS